MLYFRHPSKPDPASPDVMKENQEYIRKRRPINFTLDDLENDEQDETFEYQNFDPMPSTSRALPSRNCKKKIHYDDKSSSEDEQNFSDRKNSIQNEDKEEYEYEYDPNNDEDIVDHILDISRQDSSSSDSDD